MNDSLLPQRTELGGAVLKSLSLEDRFDYVVLYDSETRGVVDLLTFGAYAYLWHKDSHPLLHATSFGDDSPPLVEEAYKSTPKCGEILRNPRVLKISFNSFFDRMVASKALGVHLPVEEWFDLSLWTSYCGLPRSLSEVGAVLGLSEDEQKIDGKALMRLFCMPQRPTKANGLRTEAYQPEEKPEEWQLFKAYAARDVSTMVAILKRVVNIPLPRVEFDWFVANEKINDAGLSVDCEFIDAALHVYSDHLNELFVEARGLGVENPNSVSQIKAFLESRGIVVPKLDRETLLHTQSTTDDEQIKKLCAFRSEMSRTSTKKLNAMLMRAM